MDHIGSYGMCDQTTQNANIYIYICYLRCNISAYKLEYILVVVGILTINTYMKNTIISYIKYTGTNISQNTRNICHHL